MTVPVLAFGPSNLDDVWTSILAANELAVTSTAARAKTDRTRLSCFIFFLLDWQMDCLLLRDLDGMSIRVADCDCFPEPCLAVRQLDCPGGYESGPAVPQRPRRIVGARAQEPGLPVDQVIGLLLRRIGTAVARRQVFEK